MGRLQAGQEIQAEVVAVTDDCIFLDLNQKSEGVLERAELEDADGKCAVKPGDRIRAYFVEEKGGELRFTTRISGEKAGSQMLESAWKSGIPVEGLVERETKGGYEVKVGTSRGFCPYSQMGFRHKEDARNFVGRTLTFRIQKFKEGGRRILLSNRAILEEEYRERLSELKEQVQVGMTVSGTVTAIQSYGAFVDIGGFQALLPVSELGRGRVEDVGSVLQSGQSVTAQVIKADWENERVSLSLKSLLADPWDTAAEKYPEGSRHTGKIARVADFGLFVTLEPGLDGLVHISELDGGNRGINLRARHKAGQSLEVAVKSVDAAHRRISLRPAAGSEQEEAARKYLGGQKDDGETYSPFAALLKR